MSGGARGRHRPDPAVLVDSSALAYLVEGAPDSPRRRAVERFLEEACDSGSEIVASAIAWAELLEGPLRGGDPGLADRYRSFLADSSRVRIAVVDVAIAEEAAALRARRKLGLADSLHIATAIVLSARAVLTNDEDLRDVPECPRVFLVDELARDPDAIADILDLR